MSRTPIFAIVIQVVTLLSSGALAKESPKEGDPSVAIRLGRIGLEHYRGERWEEALESFHAAARVRHSPVFVLYEARCLKRLGRWREAILKFEMLLATKADAADPTSWHEAHSAALHEVTSMRAELPRLTLLLISESVPNLTVTVDGAAVSFEQGTAQFTLDPGQHTVTVFRGAFALESRAVDLRPSHQPIQLVLGPYTLMSGAQPTAIDGANAAKPLRTGLGEATEMRKAKTHSAAPVEPLRSAAWLALGVGILGVGVGTVSGIIAWRDRNALVDYCGGWSCSIDAAGRIERGRAYANLSTAALVVSGVGFASAGVLFYFTPKDTQQNRALALGVVGRF